MIVSADIAFPGYDTFPTRDAYGIGTGDWKVA
jgi:hypothetical protein